MTDDEINFSIQLTVDNTHELVEGFFLLMTVLEGSNNDMDNTDSIANDRGGVLLVRITNSDGAVYLMHTWVSKQA